MTQRAQSASPDEQSAGISGYFDTGQHSPMLGQYQLLGKLGEGGMGEVYRALHKRLNRLVAVKVLPAWRLQDAVAVARFEREMQAVGSLDHPHIVRAMDAGVHEGTHYLVMELVAGLNVGEVVRRLGSLSVADACEIVRQAALGLQHAYENGLVHRDLKPSNLMLAEGPDGVRVKILDLGLALLQHTGDASQITGSDEIVGTIDYMAPEQAGSTHTVDIRADLYSLGATLHKLLTRRVPFQGPEYSTTVKKLVALTTEDPPPIDTVRPDLPPELVAIVHRLLARDPNQRYATPQELAEALAPLTAGADLAGLLAAAQQAQPQAPAPPSSISERGTPPFAAATVVAAVLLVGGALLAWNVSRETDVTFDDVAEGDARQVEQPQQGRVPQIPEPPVVQRGEIPPPAMQSAPASSHAGRENGQEFLERAASLTLDERVTVVQERLSAINGADKVQLHGLALNDGFENLVIVLDPEQSWDLGPLTALGRVRQVMIPTGHATQDLSCLKSLEVQELNCPEEMVLTNHKVLGTIPSLATINGAPTKDAVSQARP